MIETTLFKVYNDFFQRSLNESRNQTNGSFRDGMYFIIIIIKILRTIPHMDL